MNALRPRPPFQVLVTMDQSRLGRSHDEVPYALRRITDAGVRISAYLTDSEIKRESAADKFMIHAIAFVDDMHARAVAASARGMPCAGRPSAGTSRAASSTATGTCAATAT